MPGGLKFLDRATGCRPFVSGCLFSGGGWPLGSLRQNEQVHASESESGLATGCRGSRLAMRAAIDSGNRRMRRL